MDSIDSDNNSRSILHPTTSTGDVTTSISSSSSSSSGIAAIVNRIKDRANQLSQERTKLQRLQNQLPIAQHEHQRKQLHHESIRQEQIQQMNTMHHYESQTLEMKHDIRALHKAIDNHHRDKDNIKHQITSIQMEHDFINEHTFVPHLLQTTIYKRQLEHQVHSLKAKRRKRKDALHRLWKETERDRETSQSMEREIRKNQDEITMMEDVEIREDEEIAAVAMQIRATLAKVSFFLSFQIKIKIVLSCSRPKMKLIDK